MGARGETWLWILQRATAVVLALAVLVHLVTLIYAVRHGVSAAAILARTQGNAAWLGFYLVFATAAALHAGIGLRAMLRELTRWRGAGVDFAALILVALIAAAGWRAAFGLFA
jgi:succinate dehydrogenase subunit C